MGADLIDTYRCSAVDQGDRCQLLVHDDGQHVACVRFEQEVRGGSVVIEYRTWGEPWTKAQPGRGGLRWAPTFPSMHERRNPRL